MVERSLSMREAPGSIPGLSILHSGVMPPHLFGPCFLVKWRGTSPRCANSGTNGMPFITTPPIHRDKFLPGIRGEQGGDLKAPLFKGSSSTGAFKEFNFMKVRVG
eukprot:747817-Hanusia_phi.AAC.1